jgi:NADH dehydrogenase/NADH:ubiquinone oxidoreductase subunit G
VALLTSPRASVETHVALRALASGPLAGARVAGFDDVAREAGALASLDALAAGRAPLEQSDLESCDVLLVAGPILVDEAPLAVLGVRAAARRGAQVFVMNAGEHFLGDVAQVRAVHPAGLAGALDAIRTAEGREGQFRGIADALRGAKRAGVLSGGDLVDASAIAAAGRLAGALGDGTRLGFVLPGPNGFGAAALAGGSAGLPALLDALFTGRVRAALVVESDLDALGEEVVRALTALELLVVIDHVPGPLVDAAHVLLPAATSYESDGVFVNRAGRAQAFAPANVAGEPVFRIIDGNGSFPRVPRSSPPFGDTRASWWALEQMRELVGGGAARDLKGLRGELAGMPGWGAVGRIEAGSDGVVLDVARLARAVGGAAAGGERPAAAREGLAIYRLDRTLGSESLSRRSEPMRRMAGPPVARVSVVDAKRLGVGDAIALEWDGHTLEIAARADASVAPGVVLVPRDAAWKIPPPQGAEVRVRAMSGSRNGGGA